MSGTFQGQSLGPWALCDPPSPKRTDLQGIVISPVKALSDQDKPVHAALVLSLSRYCGHVNGHFHHNWPRFWQYCSAGPSFLYSLVPSPPSPSPSINDFFFLSVWSFLLCALSVSFLSPATTEANRYGWCRVKPVSLPIHSHLRSPTRCKRTVSRSLWLSGLIL